MKLDSFIKISMLAVSISVMPAGVFAQATGLGISEPTSPHNFSGPGDTWNLTGEICRVCHVPHDHHRAEQRYLNGLLWNHRLSSAAYTMYDSSWSSTLNGAQSAQPDGIAKLCLGCHDGTIAIDTFDKYGGGSVFMEDVNLGFKIPAFNNGTELDLRGTHPISITYDPAADTKLNPISTAMGSSGTIADVLDNGKVQCSSCHDVHDQETVVGTHLLRAAQTGASPSGLCLTCHIK
jgi:hypothetical protein